MTLQTLFQQTPLVTTDGAMGTYFSEKTGLDPKLCEVSTLTNAPLIQEIHRSYLDAGAKLLRTNTFSANRYTLGVSHDDVAAILEHSYHIATQCAAEQAVVCADVSVLYDNTLSSEEIRREYAFLIDTFLSCGATTFLFETLPDLQPILPAIDYLLSKAPQAEVITSFTVLPDGRTRSGTSLTQLLKEIASLQEQLTMVGLNCGCGALQMLPHAAAFFSYIRKHTNLYTCAMPNAGYPAIENGRTIFTATPEYFAAQTARLLPLGLNAVGGCCGTTPDFIRLLDRYVQHPDQVPLTIPAAPKSTPARAAVSSDTSPTASTPNTPSSAAATDTSVSASHLSHHFIPPKASCLTEDRFILAAELDPPISADLSKLIHAAHILKESGVSVVTVSDSPLGHARMDSVICSSKIQRDVGIEALPHICCRDKNLNALRALLLGAHCEGIRSVLAVTGDTIAETDRGLVKPVFNVDSTRLMELIGKLNEDIFSEAPLTIGGAYDPTPRKQTYSLNRLAKKQRNGARFVLTQPVFSAECLPSIDAARAQGMKVLVGLMPLVSYRNASFMKNEVPGVNIPDSLLDRFDPSMSREEATAVGVAITVELARLFRSHADGFYFMTPFNRADVIRQIIETLPDQ